MLAAVAVADIHSLMSTRQQLVWLAICSVWIIQPSESTTFMFRACLIVFIVWLLFVCVCVCVWKTLHHPLTVVSLEENKTHFIIHPISMLIAIESVFPSLSCLSGSLWLLLWCDITLYIYIYAIECVFNNLFKYIATSSLVCVCLCSCQRYTIYIWCICIRTLVWRLFS